MFIILYIVRRSRDFIAVDTLFFDTLLDIQNHLLDYATSRLNNIQCIYNQKVNSGTWIRFPCTDCLYVYISLHMKVNTITIICFPLIRKKEENGRPEKPVYKCFSFTRFYLFIVFYCQIKKKWFNWRCTRYTGIWDTFGNDHRDYI